MMIATRDYLRAILIGLVSLFLVVAPSYAQESITLTLIPVTLPNEDPVAGLMAEVVDSNGATLNFITSTENGDLEIYNAPEGVYTIKLTPSQSFDLPNAGLYRDHAFEVEISMSQQGYDSETNTLVLSPVALQTVERYFEVRVTVGTASEIAGLAVGDPVPNYSVSAWEVFGGTGYGYSVTNAEGIAYIAIPEGEDLEELAAGSLWGFSGFDDSGTYTQTYVEKAAGEGSGATVVEMKVLGTDSEVQISLLSSDQSAFTLPAEVYGSLSCFTPNGPHWFSIGMDSGASGGTVKVIGGFLYQCEAWIEGYGVSPVTTEVAAGQSASVNLEVLSKDCKIAIRALDSTTNEPISGHKVQLMGWTAPNENGLTEINDFIHGESDTGQKEFDVLCDTVYETSVYIEPATEVTGSSFRVLNNQPYIAPNDIIPVLPTAGTTKTVDFLLSRASGTIIVNMTDAEGNPQQHGWADLWCPGSYHEEPGKPGEGEPGEPEEGATPGETPAPGEGGEETPPPGEGEPGQPEEGPTPGETPPPGDGTGAPPPAPSFQDSAFHIRGDDPGAPQEDLWAGAPIQNGQATIYTVHGRENCILSAFPDFSGGAQVIPPAPIEVEPLADGETRKYDMASTVPNYTLSVSAEVSTEASIKVVSISHTSCYAFTDDGSQFAYSDNFLSQGDTIDLPMSINQEAPKSWWVGCYAIVGTLNNEKFYFSQETQFTPTAGTSTGSMTANLVEGHDYYPQQQIAFQADQVLDSELPGNARISCPAGALAASGNGTMTVESAKGYAIVGEQVPHKPYDVDFVVDGTEVNDTLKPCTLCFHITVAELAELGIENPGEDLSYGSYNKDTRTWSQDASASYDTENEELCGTVKHFTVWGPLFSRSDSNLPGGGDDTVGAPSDLTASKDKSKKGKKKKGKGKKKSKKVTMLFNWTAPTGVSSDSEYLVEVLAEKKKKKKKGKKNKAKASEPEDWSKAKTMTVSTTEATMSFKKNKKTTYYVRVSVVGSEAYSDTITFKAK